MRRTLTRIDPVVAVVALIAGAAALFLGAGGWVLPVVAVVLVVAAAGEQIWIWGHEVRMLLTADEAERRLIHRAFSAVQTARRLNRAAPPGRIAERFRAAEVQLKASRAGISSLIFRAVAVRRLRNGIDPSASTRVNVVLVDLHAKAQALVESLESVVARQIEVLALADVDPLGTALAALDRLAIEVEALHAGLDEAQRLGAGLPMNELLEEKK